jgi:malate dehydrogenase (oxaloacetate-decarboxylating)(NADP+)
LEAYVATTSISNRAEAMDWYHKELRRLHDMKTGWTKFQEPYLINKRGLNLLHEPLLNKGTGFEVEERDSLRLRGLVPPRKLSLDVQATKVMHSIRRQDDPIQKNLFLQSLQNRNEVLFYRTLIDNIQELAPIVYTPVIGAVCQKFGGTFRQPRGMYFCGR